jgi:uncharacterized protein (TIGR03437 family)
VTNSPNSVNKARNHANSLSQTTADYAGAADGSFTENVALASDISSLTTDIQQAYSDFKSESASFGGRAPAIDAQITAALLFSKASNGLAMRAATSSSIKNDLQRVASHLAIAEDLMVSGFITSTTANQAIATNTLMNVVVGQANTGYGLSLISSVAPASLTAISGSGNVQPMASQSMSATLSATGDLPYEVAGVSVTVGGFAVPVVYASPWGIKFYMPSDVQPGTAEIIVTSQDGYVCQGLVTVEKNVSRIMTLADEDSGPALVINTQTVTTTDLGVITEGNFGPDKQTRLAIFATGISGSVSNTDITNDVTINGVLRPNLAESVQVEAQTTDGHVYQLPVDFAGAQGQLPGLDQVTFRVIPQLTGAGNVQLTLIVGGRRSNAPSIWMP